MSDPENGAPVTGAGAGETGEAVPPAHGQGGPAAAQPPAPRTGDGAAHALAAPEGEEAEIARAAPQAGVLEPRADAPGVAPPDEAIAPPAAAAAVTRAAAPASPAAPASRRSAWGGALGERPEATVAVPRRRLAAQSRRDFLLFGGGLLAALGAAWWLLPDAVRSRLLSADSNHRLDTLAARVGLTGARRERTLDRALTFDDDVAEALYSKDRRVRTYERSEVTPLRNNYAGRTPGPEYLPTWQLQLSGLASGRIERLSAADLAGRFALHEQVTRLVCVEGWSAVAWWGGIRFADLLDAFPPAQGARWAAIRSAVNLDVGGRPDPYYVSIDLETARHLQTLLATHQGGQPLGLEHGAPMRLLVPMKLGLKNIKAITDIAYTASEPPDYWHRNGYSKYDGL